MFYDHEGNILEPYSKAPLEVLHDKELKDFSKLLYFEMFSIYDQNKEVNDYIFTKDETLADKMGVSISKIEKALKDLEVNKYIKRVTSRFSKELQAKKRIIYLRPLHKNDQGKISYVTFPKSLYHRELRDAAKLILLELISLSEITEADYGAVEVSNNVLAEKLGKNRSTIIRNINQLKELGYIYMSRTETNKRYIFLENSEIWFKSYAQIY